MKGEGEEKKVVSRVYERVCSSRSLFFSLALETKTLKSHTNYPEVAHAT